MVDLLAVRFAAGEVPARSAVEDQRHRAVSENGGAGVLAVLRQVLPERLDHDLFGVEELVDDDAVAEVTVGDHHHVDRLLLGAAAIAPVAGLALLALRLRRGRREQIGGAPIRDLLPPIGTSSPLPGSRKSGSMPSTSVRRTSGNSSPRWRITTAEPTRSMRCCTSSPGTRTSSTRFTCGSA